MSSVSRGIGFAVPEDMREAWRAASAVWPSVVVSEQEFLAYVGARAEGGRSQDPASPGAPLQLADLYLACACARGDAAALAAFEAMVIPEVDAAIRRFAGTIAPDEIKQLLRHKLFVGNDAGGPKIQEYAGRGRLRTWVRMAATRIALNLVQSGARERPVDKDTIAQIIGAGEDPELMYLKRRYAAEFRVAFGEAFTGLDSRERNLLRYAFGEGLTVDAVGALYGVHRATAARWVTKAHSALVEQVRKSMLARLHVDKEEYASILRLIESQLEISFERYLGAPVPDSARAGNVGT